MGELVWPPDLRAGYRLFRMKAKPKSESNPMDARAFNVCFLHKAPFLPLVTGAVVVHAWAKKASTGRVLKACTKGKNTPPHPQTNKSTKQKSRSQTNTTQQHKPNKQAHEQNKTSQTNKQNTTTQNKLNKQTHKT